MSLKDQWDADRVKRQQEVSQRRQQVVEELQAFYAERVALHQHQRETLGQFHQSLIVEVDAFLKQTRSHQQKVWQEQGQERAAYIAALRDYVAALRDYVWG